MSDIVKLPHASGAHASVHLFGATVLEYATAQEPERNVLFVSKKALLDGSKPIRGGIPLVFPVFGAAEGFPNHGFARISNWKLKSMNPGQDDVPTVAVFAFVPTEASQKMYAFEFSLEYTVKVFADTLQTALAITNTSSAKPMAFQALLHTYFNVDHVEHNGCVVEGLKNVEYVDKVLDGHETEANDAIAFDKETDRVYINAPDQLVVRLQGPNTVQRVISITKSAVLDSSTPQLCDAVVWNPWIEKAKGMSDFGDDEYKTMVCVEPGRVSEPQHLHPGKVFTLQQVIHVASTASAL